MHRIHCFFRRAPVFLFYVPHVKTSGKFISNVLRSVTTFPELATVAKQYEQFLRHDDDTLKLISGRASFLRCQAHLDNEASGNVAAIFLRLLAPVSGDATMTRPSVKSLINMAQFAQKTLQVTNPEVMMSLFRAIDASVQGRVNVERVPFAELTMLCSCIVNSAASVPDSIERPPRWAVVDLLFAYLGDEQASTNVLQAIRNPNDAVNLLRVFVRACKGASSKLIKPKDWEIVWSVVEAQLPRSNVAQCASLVTLMGHGIRRGGVTISPSARNTARAVLQDRVSTSPSSWSWKRLAECAAAVASFPCSTAASLSFLSGVETRSLQDLHPRDTALILQAFVSCRGGCSQAFISALVSASLSRMVLASPTELAAILRCLGLLGWPREDSQLGNDLLDVCVEVVSAYGLEGSAGGLPLSIVQSFLLFQTLLGRKEFTTVLNDLLKPLLASDTLRLDTLHSALILASHPARPATWPSGDTASGAGDDHEGSERTDAANALADVLTANGSATYQLSQYSPQGVPIDVLVVNSDGVECAVITPHPKAFFAVLQPDGTITRQASGWELAREVSMRLEGLKTAVVDAEQLRGSEKTRSAALQGLLR